MKTIILISSLLCVVVLISCTTSKKEVTKNQQETKKPGSIIQGTMQASQKNLRKKKASPNFNLKPSTKEKRETNNTHQVMANYRQQFKNLRPVDNKTIQNSNSIQLCILLDTSSSMSGLINQAKSQLWLIVNELAKSQKNNKKIKFEVALYEYGNTSIKREVGFVRKISGFTNDLDLLSEKLFQLTTSGGDEFCGHAIAASLNQLQWNTSPDSLKIVYIAGNEPFNQGTVDFKVSCKLAAERGIIINTIHCGNNQSGIIGHWQEGAILGKGSYFSIDSNQITAGITTPFDDDLNSFSTKLNATYVYYGQSGLKKFKRQKEQDQNAKKLSKSVYSQRNASKSSHLYCNNSWDLVDASDDKKFSIKNVDKKTLPKSLQKKTDKELTAYIDKKKSERNVIKQKMIELNKKRTLYIQKKQAEKKDDKNLGTVILKSIHFQAKDKQFSFKN